MPSATRPSERSTASPSPTPSTTSTSATTLTASKMPSTEPPSFLSLPTELRTKIYFLALTRDQAFLWPGETPHHLTPALLATCSQIHAEATPLLYKHNRFSFKHPSDCNIFSRIMSRRHVRLIPKVGFHVREKDTSLFISYFASTDPVRGLAADLPGLGYIIVFLSQTWPGYRDPDDALKNWVQNQALRKICMSLEGRTPAEVTVLCSVRVHEQLFGHLRRGHPEMLMVLGPGHMRTKPEVVAGARVMLEVFCVVGEGGVTGAGE